MRFSTSFWILISLVLFFTFVSEAILSIKMLQFRNQLIKSQIMNYEFSSKALREKFKGMLGNSDDIKSEIQANVLESSILNFDKLTVTSSLNFRESIGLVIVNIVRKLSLKSFMRFLDEQENLTKLQYAFLLERNQRCKIASEKYKELESDLHDVDDISFVRLHEGYCLAIIGEKSESITKLESIINSNPGTHFSESAEILISVMRESEKRKMEIQSNNYDIHQKARAYFNSGQFFEAHKVLNEIPELSLPEKYMKARSMEKIGKTQEAISEYFLLSEQVIDRKVAIDANRRLLVLGKIYDAGDKVTKIAEKKADELKDSAIVTVVNEVADLKLKPIVLEKLKKEERVNISNTSKPIENEIILPQALEKKIVQIEAEELVPKLMPNRIWAYLSDGRIIKGTSLQINKTEVIMQTNLYEMSFPYSMLDKLEADEKPKKKKNSILLKLSRNRNLVIDSLEKSEEKILISRKGNIESFLSTELISATVK